MHCNGIVSGSVCCLASCGTCGESGCSRRPGGQEGCCKSNIKVGGRLCAEVAWQAPCSVHSPSKQGNADSDESSSPVVIGVAVAVAVSLIMAAVALFLFKRKKDLREARQAGQMQQQAYEGVPQPAIPVAVEVPPVAKPYVPPTSSKAPRKYDSEM